VPGAKPARRRPGKIEKLPEYWKLENFPYLGPFAVSKK